MVPDVNTCHALVIVCEMGKQPEQPLVPNVITDNSLTSTCEMGKQPDDTLISTCVNDDVVPNVITLDNEWTLDPEEESQILIKVSTLKRRYGHLVQPTPGRARTS